MSVGNTSWVFEHSPYRLGARLVHLALADAANEGHDNLLWETQSRTAAKAKVSRATVNSVMQQMVEDGWLDEVTDADSLEAARKMMRDPRAKVHRFRTTCRVSDTSSPAEPVKSADATCQESDARPVKSADPLLLPTQEELKGTERDPLYGFDHFWEAYPKRNGKRVGKAKCQALWKKLGRGDRLNAYHGAVNLAASIVAGTWPSAKDPERFLRDQVWVDWQEKAVASPNGHLPPGDDGSSLAEMIAASRALDDQEGRSP